MCIRKTSSKINPFWVLNSEYEIYYFGLIFVITERHFCCWNTIWNYYPTLNSLWFSGSSHFRHSLLSKFFMGDKIWSKAQSWLKIFYRLEKYVSKFLQIGGSNLKICTKLRGKSELPKQNSNSRRLMENRWKFYKFYMWKVLKDRFRHVITLLEFDPNAMIFDQNHWIGKPKRLYFLQLSTIKLMIGFVPYFIEANLY